MVTGFWIRNRQLTTTKQFVRGYTLVYKETIGCRRE